jgi:hypothetical protein
MNKNTKVAKSSRRDVNSVTRVFCPGVNTKTKIILK